VLILNDAIIHLKYPLFAEIIVFIPVVVLCACSMNPETAQFQEYESAKYLLYLFVHVFMMVQFYLIGKAGVSYNYHTMTAGFSITAGGILSFILLVSCGFGLYTVIR
jgi:hypothetical protein